MRSLQLFFLIVATAVFFIPFDSYSQDLSERVSHRLDSVDLEAHEIDISTDRGVVTLSGWVTSAQDKEKILAIVKSVEGVDQLIETIKIEKSSSPVLNDKDLSDARLAEVNAAAEEYLQALALKGPYSLQYELSEQGVLIKGELPAGTEKQALIYHLKRNVSTPISEQINVRPWPSDAELQDRVKSQLKVKQGLDLNGISITVKSGVVTLKGHRKNHLEADQLAAAVLMVEGVRDVVSEVTFSGSRNDPR